MAKKTPAHSAKADDAQKASKSRTAKSGAGSAAAKKSAAAPASAAAAAPARKPAAAAKKPAPAQAPIINTSLAATTAAAMVARRGAQVPAEEPQAGKKESAAFKQLKAGLNKPAGAPLGGAFAVPQPTKKSPVPFGGAKQVGHNQTFGADVNRAGVPRRTPG